MKIKKDCDIQSDDFYYDFFVGGYISPSKILEKESDVKKVNEAKAVIQELYESCRSQIEGFEG